jgi:hypothetical protein
MWAIIANPLHLAPARPSIVGRRAADVRRRLFDLRCDDRYHRRIGDMTRARWLEYDP